MSTVAEQEPVIVEPLKAGSAAFPPAKSANPFARPSIFPGQIAEELEAEETAEQEPPVEEPETDATPEDEQAEPSAAASEVDPLVAEAVERLGISQKAAESLGEELIDLLAAVDRQVIASYHDPTPPQQAQPPTPPPVEPAKSEVPPVKPLGKLKVELDPEVYDEEQIKTFTTLVDEINSQRDVIQALAQLAVTTHDGIQKVTGQTQAEAEAHFERLADSFFSGLGDGFGDLFGKEPIRQLPMQSPKIQSRNEVVEQALALKAIDEQKNRPVKTDDQYLQRALRALHADKLKNIARREVLGEVSQRRKQAIQRPSGSNGVALTPRQKAEKHIADSMRRMGITPED